MTIASVEELVERGLAAYSKGAYDDAIALWEHALSLDDSHVQAREYRDHARALAARLPNSKAFGMRPMRDSAPFPVDDEAPGLVPASPLRPGRPLRPDLSEGGWALDDPTPVAPVSLGYEHDPVLVRTLLPREEATISAFDEAVANVSSTPPLADDVGGVAGAPEGAGGPAGIGEAADEVDVANEPPASSRSDGESPSPAERSREGTLQPFASAPTPRRTVVPRARTASNLTSRGGAADVGAESTNEVPQAAAPHASASPSPAARAPDSGIQRVVISADQLPAMMSTPSTGQRPARSSTLAPVLTPVRRDTVPPIPLRPSTANLVAPESAPVASNPPSPTMPPVSGAVDVQRRATVPPGDSSPRTTLPPMFVAQPTRPGRSFTKTVAPAVDALSPGPSDAVSEAAPLVPPAKAAGLAADPGRRHRSTTKSGADLLDAFEQDVEAHTPSGPSGARALTDSINASELVESSTPHVALRHAPTTESSELDIVGEHAIDERIDATAAAASVVDAHASLLETAAPDEVAAPRDEIVELEADEPDDPMFLAPPSSRAIRRSIAGSPRVSHPPPASQEPNPLDDLLGPSVEPSPPTGGEGVAVPLHDEQLSPMSTADEPPVELSGADSPEVRAASLLAQSPDVAPTAAADHAAAPAPTAAAEHAVAPEQEAVSSAQVPSASEPDDELGPPMGDMVESDPAEPRLRGLSQVELAELPRIESDWIKQLQKSGPPDELPGARIRRVLTRVVEAAEGASAAGDHARAVRLLDQGLDLDAESVAAQKFLHLHKDRICGVLRHHLGSLRRCPSLEQPMYLLANATISPRAAYLLSRVDGATSFEELIDISGMQELEATRILAVLLLRGFIR